jgi:hypothetical protein
MDILDLRQSQLLLSKDFVSVKTTIMECFTTYFELCSCSSNIFMHKNVSVKTTIIECFTTEIYIYILVCTDMKTTLESSILLIDSVKTTIIKCFTTYISRLHKYENDYWNVVTSVKTTIISYYAAWCTCVSLWLAKRGIK